MKDPGGVCCGQLVFALANKGQVFRDAIELRETAVSQGPLVETLLEEMLGIPISAVEAGSVGTRQRARICRKCAGPPPRPLPRIY